MLKKTTKLYAALAITCALVLVLTSACGNEEPPETQTSKLTMVCAVTEAFSLEIPMLVARGQEPIPSGFDAINRADCDFSVSIDTVVLELAQGGSIAAQHSVSLDSASTVPFPLPEAEAAVASANVAPGLYDRRIEAVATDGQRVQVRNDEAAVYVVDLTPEDTESARRALIAAREALAELLLLPAAEPPQLVELAAVEWGDASLGCPEPGMMYVQVITPGFSFRFNHDERVYEYHTSQDGSSVVQCEPER